MKPAGSSPRFGAWWIGTLAACAMGAPLLTAVVYNTFDSVNANFIENLYLRKEAAIAARSSPAPRLFLIAGSSAYFSLDAELIEKKTGIPSINLGTHAGLGMSYILDRAKRYLRKDDIAVLALEYHMFLNPEDGFSDIELAYFTSYDRRHYLELGPSAAARVLFGLPLNEYAKSLDRWHSRLTGTHFDPKNIYDFTYSSPNGDIREKGLTPPVHEAFYFGPTLQAPAVAKFNEFLAWAKSNGVEVRLTYPTLGIDPAESAAITGLAEVEKLYRRSGPPTLETPAATTFPTRWFYDSRYHANQALRRLRTENLIAAIRPAQAPSRPRLYVLGSPEHRIHEANILPGGTTFRILSDIPHPSAITASALAEAVAKGAEVFYDDPGVEAALAQSAIGVSPVKSAKMSPASVTETTDRLYLLCDATTEKAAIMGSGRYRHLTREAKAIADTLHLPLATGALLTYNVAIAAGKTCSVRLNGWEHGAAAGINIAKLDPARGILEGRWHFDSAAESADWELKRADTTKAPAIKGDRLPFDLFIPTGQTRPELRIEGRAMKIRFTGRESVWGLPIGNLPRQGNDVILKIRYRQTGPAPVRLVFHTNVPALLQSLPDPRTLNPAGGEASVRISFKPGTAFGKDQWAVVGLQGDQLGATADVSEAWIYWLK